MVLLLTACILFIASTNQTAYARDNKSSSQPRAIFATNAIDGGRLIIKYSPTLGINVAIVLTIDGKLVGPLVRGHIFDRYLTPGRHILVASPNRLAGDWQGVLHVRAGHTYTYIARYNVSRLVLYPVTASR
jgi:hypothetical protein